MPTERTGNFIIDPITKKVTLIVPSYKDNASKEEIPPQLAGSIVSIPSDPTWPRRQQNYYRLTKRRI